MATVIKQHAAHTLDNATLPSEPFAEATAALTGLVAVVRDWLAGQSNWTIALTLLLVAMSYDQFMYQWRKGSIAGPRFKTPFMGPFLQSIAPKFDGYLKQWASGPLSCVSIFNHFVVMVSDRDLAHKVFKSPTYVKPCLVNMATHILQPEAFVFLNGKAHTEFRRGLATLFTPKALSLYLPRQERVMEEYFEKWIELTKEAAAAGGPPFRYQHQFREIECALSCKTFIGDYMPLTEMADIVKKFYQVTEALELVNIPFTIYIPGTKVWRGNRQAQAARASFRRCAELSMKAMAQPGAEATCLVDQWVLNMMESERYHQRVAAGETGLEKPKNLIRQFTSDDIARTLVAFLFASQDASSSATSWAFQVLAQEPEVLDKIRAENLAVRGGDRNVPFSLDIFDKLPYTNAAIKEVLRWRPPVIFVPYRVTKDFPVTPEYTVPKGSMVMPTCYPALHDPVAYPNPDKFDPDRWITGDAEKHTKNWLVFGAGAHDCLARKYVPVSMAHMLGKASMELDWEYHPNEKSDVIRVFAGLFPMDDCPLTFQARPE